MPPATPFVVQVRAWEVSAGASYEEARALGGRFGRSGLLAREGSDPAAGEVASLRGLPYFALSAGLPGFTVGRISPEPSLGDGTPVWRLSGAPGFRYLLEKRVEGAHWKPVDVYGNFPGSVTFTTPLSDGSTVLYRARILD